MATVVRKLWTRFRGECSHDHMLVVTSVGIRRSLCEDCGHISFHSLPNRPRPDQRPAMKQASGL